MTDSNDPTRRRFLTATAGATASALLLAGCSSGGGNGGGDDDAPSEVNDYLSDANNYDDIVDETGSDAVEVAVGPNGENSFGPAAVRVSTGTTITWDWKNGSHNVVPDTTPDGSDWSGDDSIERPDYSHEHTFETAGTYLYYCSPHEQVGMKGAVVVEE